MSAETIEYAAEPVTAAVPTAFVPIALCRCGHEADAHEHYRPGHDCTVCGPARCRSFRKRTGRAARTSGWAPRR